MISPRENELLFGHGMAETAMRSALASGRLHHAWLITGVEGVGKATLAYRFARLLLGGGQAVFRRVAAGTHADLLTIEREWDEKKKRLKKTIAAETARGIPPFLHLTPAEGGYRVVIVDGAEDLNPQSANALLKVLEEPPAKAVLILVCSAAGRLLPTIRSRCRHLPLGPLSDEEMAAALAAYLPELTAAERTRLARLADGSPGRALALAEEGGLRLAEMAEEVLRSAPQVSLVRAYEFSDALREQAPFEIFFGFLQRGIAAAVGAYVRGSADAAQVRLVENGGPARWAETAQRLAALAVQTEAANMDRRQAVVAGLALLRAA